MSPSSEGGGELRERLRRLRREPVGEERAAESTGPATEPARRYDAQGTLPIWVERKLAGRARRALARAEGPPEALAERRPGPPADLEESSTKDGRCAARTTRYAQDHLHGSWSLDAVRAIAREDITLCTRDPGLADFDPRRAVYLDIETTGLSGGAGTIPFLVALGRFDSAGFELWQGFLHGPEDEEPLLEEVARRVRASGAIVSFFGKSFDRHRLEDKMRLHGVEPPFDGRPHLDLFHPLARLYRPAFPDGRLATMESRLCGVRRENDLPGSYAPEAWFDYLADRAHRLEAVFRHNADDVLSLVTLTAHLGRSCAETRPDGQPLDGPDWTRAEALARLFAERGEHAPALQWTERSLARTEGDRRPLTSLRADLLRLSGEAERALADYEALVDGVEDPLALQAWIQIAKVAEHRLRDLQRARAAVAEARRLAPRVLAGPRRARTLREIEHRGERLERKLGAV